MSLSIGNNRGIDFQIQLKFMASAALLYGNEDLTIV